jgi:glycine/D-amino acid oxidase-like deaminating enzyme
MNVVVIGAGIVGAALADRLAATGARVTVVDAGAPGRGTSAISLAWLNANATLDPGYFGFRVAAMRAWAELAAEFGEPRWYVPTGNLAWTETDAAREEMSARVDRLRGRGYPARLVTAAEAAAIEPALRAAPPPGALTAHFPAEGYVHGAQAVQMLLGRAQRAGARVVAGSRVTGLDVGGGRVTGVRLAAGQRLAADAVVCAAGWRANEVLATIDAELPLTDAYEPGSPAICVIATATAPDILRGIVHAPDVHVRAAWPGGLLMLPGDGGAAVDMSTTEAELATHATGLLGHARRVLAGLNGARLTAVWRCVRPLPADGFPLVGWQRPGLYVAVTHSGITLGPYLARLIASELRDGAEAPELAPYRPYRAAAGVTGVQR